MSEANTKSPFDQLYDKYREGDVTRRDFFMGGKEMGVSQAILLFASGIPGRKPYKGEPVGPILENIQSSDGVAVDVFVPQNE